MLHITCFTVFALFPSSSHLISSLHPHHFSSPITTTLTSQKGANSSLLNGTGEKASDLTTDAECIFICDHFDEYVKMAKDGKKFAKVKTILAVDPTFSNFSTGPDISPRCLPFDWIVRRLTGLFQ